jgi:hypothetical protein
MISITTARTPGSTGLSCDRFQDLVERPLAAITVPMTTPITRLMTSDTTTSSKDRPGA